MQYMNVVRVRIQPGQFATWQARAAESLATLGKAEGLLEARVLQTGERSVCYVARWKSAEAFSAARPQLIAALDRVRDLLEPLGDLGVTDPVSGPVILAY